MPSSFFSGPADSKAPNFHPVVTSKTAPGELFTKLEPKDLEWNCAKGSVTETQNWYNFLEDGTLIWFQVIHSGIGLWYPQIKLTCRIFHPKTRDTTWKSINITNFVTPPTGKDRRSSKSDQFTITHGPGTGGFAEQYLINANLDNDLQLALTISRPATADGFKVGRGESFFGTDVNKPEGFVINRFWPRTNCAGDLIKSGQAIKVQGVGVFVHTIQGMRPNRVAARWNFANFQSHDEEVSAIQMEFTTIQAYGREGVGSGGVSVNVGGVVVGGKLVAVTGETVWPGEVPVPDAPVQSRVAHLGCVHDPETGYKQPSQIRYTWQAPSIGDAVLVKAELIVDVGTPSAPKGLVAKIDVLSEIPAALKRVVKYVTNTRPYIYQWMNPSTLSVIGPESLIPGGCKAVDGTLYSQASFLSESD
ncbi:survival factor 1, related protein [Rhizoctonia solani AG-3 Rhs1AP]|uniref:Survival factor 1, related protein n=2 Tax=Rhizoctonia solani AG-3 TaxID=1086053 RepID=A0A074RJD8_9AGAM|nr:survival factor 1, related protein [Rhizoctonia solani AG-3 Rhs1AP]KEP45495.1 survival factor 1, related protein [Rhizoctonia solani 123E]